MRRLARGLAAVALACWSAGAQACLFSKDVPPDQWFAWSAALFAGEVTKLASEREGGVDVVTVRVLETFKGTEGDAATLKLPARMWADCRIPRPSPGERVLVALNAHGDAEIVPLALIDVAGLRTQRGKLHSKP